MEIGKGSDTSQRKHKPTLFEWKRGTFTEVGKRVWGWMGFFDELVLRGYCRWFFFSSLNFYTFRWPIGGGRCGRWTGVSSLYGFICLVPF